MHEAIVKHLIVDLESTIQIGSRVVMSLRSAGYSTDNIQRQVELHLENTGRRDLLNHLIETSTAMHQASKRIAEVLSYLETLHSLLKEVPSESSSTGTPSL